MVPSEKKIAYAASFGVSEITENRKKTAELLDGDVYKRQVLDDDGVVRNSVARIEGGVLHIEQGHYFHRWRRPC